MTVVLDREQLREVTLEDEDLMRQLLAALIEDTERQMPLLEKAIRTPTSSSARGWRIIAKAPALMWGPKRRRRCWRGSSGTPRWERWGNAARNC